MYVGESAFYEPLFTAMSGYLEREISVPNAINFRLDWGPRTFNIKEYSMLFNKYINLTNYNEYIDNVFHQIFSAINDKNNNYIIKNFIKKLIILIIITQFILFINAFIILKRKKKGKLK